MKDQKRMLIPDNSWDAGIMESWLEDMARWTTYPEDWPDMAQAGGKDTANTAEAVDKAWQLICNQ